MYKLFRFFLFCLSPERAHRVSIFFLKILAKLPYHRKLPNKPVFLLEHEFPNPIGIAAGYDKNGEAIDGLFALGFGFVEVGTVTPKAQNGNPEPRLFRIPKAEAVINRMGFNNEGVDHLIKNIKNRKSPGILAINIGKNSSTPIENAHEDYLLCLEKVYSYADFIVINISSPNTKNLRDLQQAGLIEGLLQKCAEKRDVLTQQTNRRMPLFLKITIDLSLEDRLYIAKCIQTFNFEGIIISNTTIDRSAVNGLPFANEAGGLSGKPLFSKVQEAIVDLRAVLPQNIVIIGVGGVFSAENAKALLAAGANLVQIYTGMVYRGPNLLAEIVESL